MQAEGLISAALPSITPRMSPSGQTERQERLPMHFSGSITGWSVAGWARPSFFASSSAAKPSASLRLRLRARRNMNTTLHSSSAANATHSS